MSAYRLLSDGSVFRVADYASIPNSVLNEDWREYLAWRQRGNIPDPVLEPVPAVISMRQARAALILNGLDEAVDAAVRAIPGVDGKLALNDWERATELRRDHPLVQALTPALGLTSEQLDALFVQASKL